MYQLSSSVGATKISLLKQEAHLWWTLQRCEVNWQKLVQCQVRANETCLGAQHLFIIIIIITSTGSSGKNPVVYKLLSQLREDLHHGKLKASPKKRSIMEHSVGKADLLSDHFESVGLPLTCHPSPGLTTFAFRSSEVRYFLLDFDPYSDTDPLGMFHLFLRELMLWPLSWLVFRRLVRLGSFLACWRQANVLQLRKVHCPPLPPIIKQFP